MAAENLYDKHGLPRASASAEYYFEALGPQGANGVRSVKTIKISGTSHGGMFRLEDGLIMVTARGTRRGFAVLTKPRRSRKRDGTPVDANAAKVLEEWKARQAYNAQQQAFERDAKRARKIGINQTVEQPTEPPPPKSKDPRPPPSVEVELEVD